MEKRKQNYLQASRLGIYSPGLCRPVESEIKGVVSQSSSSEARYVSDHVIKKRWRDR